ncbi:mucin-associated surface protein (MASP), putative, partial [Trypanosoma cruzi marinkellei]
MRAAAGAGDFLFCCALYCFAFTLLCVDGELVCAEGCTQVIGVMMMMMTGRVLLVCALCVLWCGGGGADDAGAGIAGDPGTHSQSGGETVGQSPPAGGSNGGSGGSKADGSHGSKGKSLDSASAEESSPLDPSPEGDLSLSEKHVLQERVDSTGKQEHSQSGTQDVSLPDMNEAETRETGPKQELSDTQKTGVLTNVGGSEIAIRGEVNTGHNTGFIPNKSDSPPLLEPQAKQVLTPAEPSPVITVSAGETNPTASTDSQNATETTSTTSPSHAETATEAPEKTLGNGAPGQQREDTDTPDSIKDASTNHPAEITASSISTSGTNATN